MTWQIFLAAFLGGVAAASIPFIWAAAKRVNFVFSKMDERFSVWGFAIGGSGGEYAGVWLHLWKFTVGACLKANYLKHAQIVVERTVCDEYRTTTLRVSWVSGFKWWILSDNGAKKMFAR